MFIYQRMKRCSLFLFVIFYSSKILPNSGLVFELNSGKEWPCRGVSSSGIFKNIYRTATKCYNNSPET